MRSGAGKREAGGRPPAVQASTESHACGLCDSHVHRPIAESPKGLTQLKGGNRNTRGKSLTWPVGA